MIETRQPKRPWSIDLNDVEEEQTRPKTRRVIDRSTGKITRLLTKWSTFRALSSGKQTPSCGIATTFEMVFDGIETLLGHSRPWLLYKERKGGVMDGSLVRRPSFQFRGESVPVISARGGWPQGQTLIIRLLLFLLFLLFSFLYKPRNTRKREFKRGNDPDDHHESRDGFKGW
jgi:hypothetical protein